MEKIIIIFHLIICCWIQENNAVYSFSRTDLRSVVRDSCVVVADIENQPSFAPSFTRLEKIFQQDVADGLVQFGKMDLVPFLNEGVGVISAQESLTLAVFPKVVTDRACLLAPGFQPDPKPVAFPGYSNDVVILVSFINNQCGTYRTTDGSLDFAGLHREHVLQNMFHIDASENALTMGQLYGWTDNPFSKASECLNSPDIVDKRQCLPPRENLTDHEKLKYIDPALNKHHHIAQCEKIQLPLSQQDFFDKYLKRSKPVIIEGAVKKWPAFSKWTQQFFRDKFGKNKVHVKLTPGGDFEGVERADLWDTYGTFAIPEAVRRKLQFPELVVVRPAGVNMNFSDFLDLITWAAEQPTRNVSAYLEYSSIPEYMPELEDDIEEFEFAKRILSRKHLNIWLSDGNTVGRLHFDEYDNFLCQLRGQKQVILFEPHDNSRLYEGHIPQATLSYDSSAKKFSRKTLQESTSMVMSPVDLLDPDLEKFPLFADVNPLNCTLDEGDVLFMPSFWWHEVYSTPSSQEKRNLAVNYWYEPFLKKEFPCASCKLDVNSFYRHLL